jgi:hypothetical protein
MKQKGVLVFLTPKRDGDDIGNPWTFFHSMFDWVCYRAYKGNTDVY